jgi:hypothetical protein
MFFVFLLIIFCLKDQSVAEQEGDHDGDQHCGDANFMVHTGPGVAVSAHSGTQSLGAWKNR